MTRRRKQARLLLALALAAACSPAPEPDAWVTIRGQRLPAERAVSDRDKARGLSGRDELAWGAGMLFEYDEPGFYPFWMRDVRFDLDLVWIRDGRIVDVHHRVPAPKSAAPEGLLPTYRPRELADTVLEVSAGFAAAHGWQPGDRVQIERSLP